MVSCAMSSVLLGGSPRVFPQRKKVKVNLLKEETEDTCVDKLNRLRMRYLSTVGLATGNHQCDATLNISCVV